AERSDIDASQALGESGWQNACPLQQLPGYLQHQPLLRVHGLRLARRDAEKLGVELIDAAQEAAVLAIGLTDGVRVWIGHRLPVPALLGNRLDRVAALLEQLPECFRVRNAARQPAGHRYDRDRLSLSGAELLVLRPEGIYLLGRLDQ